MNVTALYLVVCVSLLGNANMRWFSLPWPMCTGKYSDCGPAVCAAAAALGASPEGGMVVMSYSRGDSRALLSSLLLLSSSPSSLGIQAAVETEKERKKEKKEAFSHSFFPLSFSLR